MGSSLRDLVSALTAGRIDRRQFLQRGSALGVSTGALVAIAHHLPAAAQTPDASPAASPAASAATKPDVGTESQQRGAGGEIRVLMVQAPSGLSVHNATGGKDITAGSIINEPLLHYGVDGSLVANLVTEVPTLENGMVAEDLSTVTFSLLPDVVWSDGKPLTADDVKFTWEWNVEPTNQSIDAASWQMVKAVDVVDPLTAKVTFTDPTIGWFQPFGSNIGAIYPKHFWDGKDAAEANKAFMNGPIGTGAFVLKEMRANDQVTYVANEKYRHPNKPFFKKLTLKGGSDPSTSLKAVTGTGEWDLAFSLMLDPETLEKGKGDKGEVIGALGTSVEKIQVNFTDPNKEVDGQRSEKNTPHPFLTDLAVRQAMAMAIDRQLLSDRLFGSPAASNMLTGIKEYESPNTTAEFDLDKAAKTLEDAGWKLNGKVREKDGVPLKLVYVSTTTQRRQKTQAVVKASLEKIGFQVEIKSVEGSIFFDGATDNTQNFTHFYSDLQEYQDGATSAFPLNYMKYWYAGKDGVNLCQKANGWTGTNKCRYQNADYDAAFEKLGASATAEDAAARFIELNDIVVNDVVEIPLVQAFADQFAINQRIRKDNVAISPFGDYTWNMENWNLAE